MTNELTKDCTTEKQLRVSQSKLRTNCIDTTTRSIQHIYKLDSPDTKTLKEALKEQRDSVLNGDTSFLESMLLTQTQTLQALFHHVAERVSYSKNMVQLQAYGNLAVKTNNACRKTILALQQIKNPSSTTFIKQQNNAVNQQVNNPVTIENSEKFKNLQTNY